MFRFSAAFLVMLSSASGEAHIGRAPHMWMFGANGVSIYTADGSQVVKSISPEKACHVVVSNNGDERLRCDFNDVVSDGNKYVWASVSSGVPKIDIFTIDTGDVVGSFSTCGSPRDLDFHPLREEIWVHCTSFSQTEESHISVLSSLSPSAPIESRITMHDNTNFRAFGMVTVDPSLGDIGYATVSGVPFLHKIDLSDRTVVEQFPLIENNDKFYGVYEMAYSPVNGHVFLRTEVCCTCGFEGADSVECGRYGSQNITVGGLLVEGQCGRHCEGGPTDNIGIIEFDTNTDTVVGTHQFVGSAPVDAPFVSPDGKYIVIFGMNGGSVVQILSAGAPGALSAVTYQLELAFDTALDDDIAVFNDFAFIQHGGQNLFVLASGADNKIAIVDMAVNPPKASYVALKTEAYTDTRSRSRQVEWVQGTNFVWVSGPSVNEAYIVDVVEKKLLRTLTEVSATKLLSVVNLRFLEFAEQMNNHNRDSDRNSDSVDIEEIRSEYTEDDEVDSDGLAIASIAISLVALFAVLANFVFMAAKGRGTSEDSSVAMKGKAEASLAVPSVN